LKIEWKSDDESIATVDENGVITVHAEGSVIISATIGDSTATILVNGTPGETIIADPSGDMPIDSGQTTNNNSVGETAEFENTEQTGENAAPVEPNELPMVPITIDETEIDTIQKGTITAREFSIIAPAKVQSQSENGGIQNWRTDEMADSAIELPIIPEENAMLPVMLFGTIAMLAIGGGMELITFKKQVGGQ
jgi:hypothetical protein